MNKISEDINQKYKKMIKQRPLDHAVLYLIQHSELIREDPIAVEKLILCCWNSRHFKSLTVVLDMLIETNFIITIDELEKIVIEYLKKGIQSNENIHKYVQMLSITKGFNLPPKVWEKYLSEILIFASKIYENKLPQSENLQDAINCAMEILIEVFNHTCTSEHEVTQNFSRILSSLFN